MVILPLNLFHFILGFGFPLAEQGKTTVSPDNTSLSIGLFNHSGGTGKHIQLIKIFKKNIKNKVKHKETAVFFFSF